MQARLPFICVAAFAFAVSSARSQSLQERVDSAARGSVIDVPAGSYAGPVVISKPLTLRGAEGARITGDGKTHVIHIAGEQVTVEGFSINGSGIDLSKDHSAVFITGNQAVVRNNTISDSLHGIYVKKANDCRLEGNQIAGKVSLSAGPEASGTLPAGPSGGETCDAALDPNRRGNGIHLWNCERIAVIGNYIRDARDGIYFSFANHSIVRRNRISHVRFGLHYMYSDGNIFEDNSFSESSAGSTLMFSRNMVVRRNTFSANVGHRAYGMVLTAVDTSRIERNIFEGNSIGLCLEYSNSNLFNHNLFARSIVGARLTASSDGNQFSRNIFAGNLHPIELDGDFSRNAWSDGKAGNRWGNSTELDFDGDGIGDVPHREADLLGELRRPFPLAGLLSGSPALEMVRFAQQHAAIPGIRSVQDPQPLTGVRR